MINIKPLKPTWLLHDIIFLDYNLLSKHFWSYGRGKKINFHIARLHSFIPNHIVLIKVNHSIFLNYIQCQVQISCVYLYFPVLLVNTHFFENIFSVYLEQSSINLFIFWKSFSKISRYNSCITNTMSIIKYLNYLYSAWCYCKIYILAFSKIEI